MFIIILKLIIHNFRQEDKEESNAESFIRCCDGKKEITNNNIIIIVVSLLLLATIGLITYTLFHYIPTGRCILLFLCQISCLWFR